MTLRRRGWTRRDLLKLGAGAAVALPALACGPEATPAPFDEGACTPGDDGASTMDVDPAATALDEGRFSCGVSSGETSPSSAIVWGFTEEDAPATLRVWREADGRRLLAFEQGVTPADGHLKAEVSGLAANTSYSFAFFGEGVPATRSTIGQFRTAYDGDCRRALTVAATACTNARFAPYRSLEAMAKHEFDVFCHLGDMTYNDGAETLEEYRAKWKATLQDPGYRALLPRAAMYITWDDHEFLDSSGLYTAPPEQLAAARDAFYETLPVKRLASDRLWRSHRWGHLVEFFVLDCRTERDPASRTGDDPIYLLKEQLAWLKEGLEASPAHFKVLLNSVPMIDWPDKVWLLEADRGRVTPAQRDELLGHVFDPKIPNVWFLSGDFHVGAVARVDREALGAAGVEILAGPGANINPLTLVYDNGSEQDREDIAPPSQFAYFGGALAATLLTFDAERDAVRVRFVGVDDQVLFDRWLSQRD